MQLHRSLLTIRFRDRKPTALAALATHSSTSEYFEMFGNRAMLNGGNRKEMLG